MSDTNEPVWIDPTNPGSGVQPPTTDVDPVEPEPQPELATDGAGARAGGGRHDDEIKSGTLSPVELGSQLAPMDWVRRRADNGKGWVWQQPGANYNANSVRVMEPTDAYPSGYVRFYNQHGQPIGLDGKPC